MARAGGAETVGDGREEPPQGQLRAAPGAGGQGGGAQEHPGPGTTAHRGRTPGDPSTAADGTTRGGSPRRGLFRAAGGAGGRPPCSGAPPTSDSAEPLWSGAGRDLRRGARPRTLAPDVEQSRMGSGELCQQDLQSLRPTGAWDAPRPLPSMGCGPASLDPVGPQSPCPSPSGPGLLPLCPQACPAVLVGLPQPSCL